MYLPPHFSEHRPDVLHALMRALPLATLVIRDAEGLDAQHVPLLLRKGATGETLAGHVARANRVWKREPIGDVLAIFSGVQGYVSPSGYRSKAEHGKVVPTWNYVVVHAHGRLRWIEDDVWIASLLEELTSAHEAGREPPWHVSDAPAGFIALQRRAIIGLEISVTRLEGKFKLSQNRTPADREGVVQLLMAAGDAGSLALAEAMRVALGAAAGTGSGA